MKNCPKCSKVHYKNGMFCSRSCANSRKWTTEQNASRKKSAQISYRNMSSDNRKKYKEGIKKSILTSKRKWKEWRSNNPTTSMTLPSIRKKLLEEQNYKCQTCNISDWLGKKLTFEIDHVDGNKNNNDRSNLRMLCPNCHSQTDTWRGRKNKSSISSKVEQATDNR